MHAHAQHDRGKHHPPLTHGPKQRRRQHAQQALGAPPRTNRSHHGIQQPNSGEPIRPARLHARTPVDEDAREEPSGEEVRGCEDELAEGEEPGGRGEEEPCQERGVAVGFAVIGGGVVGDEAGGVGEDEVVDVSVFDGGVGILEEAVEEEG